MLSFLLRYLKARLFSDAASLNKRLCEHIQQRHPEWVSSATATLSGTNKFVDVALPQEDFILLTFPDYPLLDFSQLLIYSVQQSSRADFSKLKSQYYQMFSD